MTFLIADTFTDSLARLSRDEQRVESRRAARRDADVGVANLKNDIALRQCELKALDRAALETRYRRPVLIPSSRSSTTNRTCPRTQPNPR